MLITLDDAKEAVNSALASYKVASVEDVWEQTKDGFKYILSCNHLISSSGAIINLKIILWVDTNKEVLTTNKLTYLYDINCVYKTYEFVDLDALKKQVKTIIEKKLFGKNIIVISDLLADSSQRVNEIFYNNKVKSYSVFSFNYEPADAITSCKNTVFKFILNVNGQNNLMLLIKLTDAWELTLNINDKTESKKINDLSKIFLFVANSIQKLI
jgi:hypothetical protein